MNLKIPFSFKLYVFITNLLLLFGIIIISDTLVSYFFFIELIFLLIFNFLVYKIYRYKKWALYFFIFIFGISGLYNIYIFFFKGGIFSGILEPAFFSSLIVASFTLFVFVKLFILIKNIKLGVDNIEEKYITNKKQGGLAIKVYALLVIFLLLFRFGYYDLPKDIEYIDDSFFTTKYENINIPTEENMYFSFKQFDYDASPSEHKSRKIKEYMVDCIYKDNCYPLKAYEEKINELEGLKYGLHDIKFQFISDRDEILEIKTKLKNTDILYMFEDIAYMEKILELISKKSYWKYPYSYNDFETLNKESLTFSWIIQYYRELRYQTFYYLENNEEDKAMKLLENMLQVGNIIIDSDGPLILKLVGITILKITYEHIDIISSNYTLTHKSKTILLKELSKKIEKSYLDNGIKHEYKIMKSVMDFMNKGIDENPWFGNMILKHKTTLYKYDEEQKWIKLYFYNIIKDPYDNLLLGEEIEQINYFKSNLIGKVLRNGYTTVYSSQYKKLNDLEIKRQQLVEKL